MDFFVNKLLISFGCSWTFGTGCNYNPGMSRDQYLQTHGDYKIANSLSFRNLLCENHGFQNLNFSSGASSNQMQFYKAEMYFSGKKFESDRELYDDIVVLWGLTSVYRNIRLSEEKNTLRIESYLLNRDNKQALKEFNEELEIYLLRIKINFWNHFFKQHNIKNLWFDTFNNHDYSLSDISMDEKQYNLFKGEDWPEYSKLRETNIEPKVLDDIRMSIPEIDLYRSIEIENFMLFDEKYDKDLLSQLSKTNSNDYHLSFWKNDDNRIQKLIEQGSINPYSLHPTWQTHKVIASMIEPYLA